MKRVTIADVAARAGVSKSTVSHALSGKRPVSAATRSRIKQAIDALDYQPNPVAQRLAGGRTGAIGYIYPLYAPHLAGLEMKFIASTANEINQADYVFMLLTHPADDVDSLRRFLASGLVDGLILMQVRLHDPRVRLLQQAEIPFVLVGRCADNRGLSFVDVDIAAAMEHCLAHLIGLGHRHIAYLHQDAHDFGFMYRARRHFLEACATQRVAPFTHPSQFAYESGAAAMTALLEQHPQVTAVISWNNAVTWGALDAARGTGRRVPEDLSIISFGHSSVSYPTPIPLTIVDIHPEQLAARAAQLLLDHLAHGGKESHILIKPTLIVRESTAIVVSNAP